MNETMTTIAAQIAAEIAHHGADTITLPVVRAHNAAEGWDVGDEPTAPPMVVLSEEDLLQVYAAAVALAVTLEDE